MSRQSHISMSAKIAAWAGVALVTWQSLVPKGWAIDMGLSDTVQHFLAYLILGAIFAVSSPAHRVVYAASLVALASGIELLQHFSPGREPSWQDAASSVAGAVIGTLLAAVCTSVWQRRREGLLRWLPR